MADPISVIGSVGAICNIIDVVGKAIVTINELQGKWRDADLTFISLTSQLTALRAALAKIQDWMDSDLQDVHHQLVMDLDVSLSCCKLLVGKIDTFLSELDHTTDTTMDFTSKAKLIFGNYNMEDVQKLIERQTTALNLLLTACNWSVQPLGNLDISLIICIFKPINIGAETIIREAQNSQDARACQK